MAIAEESVDFAFGADEVECHVFVCPVFEYPGCAFLAGAVVPGGAPCAYWTGAFREGLQEGFGAHEEQPFFVVLGFARMAVRMAPWLWGSVDDGCFFGVGFLKYSFPEFVTQRAIRD